MIRQGVMSGGTVNGFVVEKGLTYQPINISFAVNGFPVNFLANKVQLQGTETNAMLTIEGTAIPVPASGLEAFEIKIMGTQWLETQ